MKWSTTWWLVALAAVLFAFIYLVERHSAPTSLEPPPEPRLVSLRASEVTNIQLRLTNRLVLKAERTNGGWHLTVPLFYPAQNDRINGLLALLENLASHKQIPVAELAARKQSVAEFGLEVPPTSLTLQHQGQRTEILFGSPTPLGDQVYVQLLAAPDIHVVTRDLANRLPKDPNEWRDASLLSVAGMDIDRLEVRTPTRGFAIVLDPTNKVFLLTKPTAARADGPKVAAFLRRLQGSQVVRFDNDAPGAELEPYGLQPPAAELVLGKGTNDLYVVQLGRSPTNDTAVVYARLMTHSNIVLVPKTILEALQTSHADLRDRHLVTFNPSVLDAIEVVGPEGFSAQRQTNHAWTVVGPPAFPADAALVRELMDRLSRLEGEVEQDVVTDLASYGLANPARQYRLLSSVTNAAGGLTNRLMAQLDLGATKENKVFVRRPDENPVYSLPAQVVASLPVAGWQLRDRRVFNFSTNQVVSVTIRHQGYERRLLRSPSGDWSLAPGSQGVINTFAVEETMHRLGELPAELWTARGDGERVKYGITDAKLKLAIELKSAEKLATVTLEFGGYSSAQFPYAAAPIDGQTWIFEFPVGLYYDVLRYLGNPPLQRPPAGP
jgi:hypothetical protein